MRTPVFAIALVAAALPNMSAIAQPPGAVQDRHRDGDRDRYDRPGDRRGRDAPDARDGDVGRQEDRQFGGGERPGDRRFGREDRRGARAEDRRADARDPRAFRNYDYNRREPGQRGYYAERYYRTGGTYRPVRLARDSRLYRGGDGRYYCRRGDGTTGLIVGAALGGLLGNQIGYGDSRTIATLLGGTGGALLGRSVDRGQLSCR